MSFKDTYHITIKFTQNDNISTGENSRGWVDYFAVFLKKSLEYRIDGEISIEYKTETELITASDFNKSDLILYILSPAFIFSSNINQDAQELETAFNFDIPFINRKLKKVFKAPVKVEDLPLSLSTPTYYRFFNFENLESEEYKTFEGWNNYQENIDFWTVFADVVNDAYNLFNLEKQDEFVKKIFISNKSPNYFHDRNNIKRELNKFNVSVFPDEDFSIEANYMEDPELFFMQKCDVSLHFPDEFIDLNVEERNKSFQKLPAANRFIWFNPNENLNPEKKAVYNELKIQLKPYKNIEAIETPIEELKDILKTNIFQENKEESVSEDKREILYLLSDTSISEDIKHDLENDTDLQSKFKLKILSNVENVADYRLMHYDLLKNADRFMIVHLQGNPEWLKTMISEVKKAPGFDRPKAVSGRYICLEELDKVSSNPYANDFQLMKINDLNDLKSIINKNIL